MPDPIMQIVTLFNEHPILVTIGTIQVLLDVVLVIFGFVANGVALYMPMRRFAQARRKKQIYVVGDVNQFESLKTDIAATGIVKEKNIRHIDKNHLDEIRTAWTIVICAEDIADEDIINILERKPAHCPAIVYAKPPKRILSQDAYSACDKHDHVAVCNFRGRLVDELITSLFTCSFEKSKS